MFERLAAGRRRLLDCTSFGLSDDFCDGLDDTDRFGIVNPDAGSSSVGDGMNGYLTLYPSDGTVTDNDEIYLYGAGHIFLPKAQKPLYAACRYHFQEVSNNTANLVFGLASTAGQNILRDNGAGMRTDGQFVGFYKIDGGRNWRVQTRDNLGVQDYVTEASAHLVSRTETIDGIVTSPTPWRFLEISLEDAAPSRMVAGRVMLATFRIDGVLLPVRHEFRVVDASLLTVLTGVKNGAAVAETFYADLLHADQTRD